MPGLGSPDDRDSFLIPLCDQLVSLFFYAACRLGELGRLSSLATGTSRTSCNVHLLFLSFGTRVTVPQPSSFQSMPFFKSPKDTYAASDDVFANVALEDGWSSPATRNEKSRDKSVAASPAKPDTPAPDDDGSKHGSKQGTTNTARNSKPLEDATLDKGCSQDC